MPAAKPWAGMDPNSAHQLWSRWTFRIESAKRVPLADIKPNFARWLRMGFGTAGRARVSEKLETIPGPFARVGHIIALECEIEGKPAHDPGYIRSVEKGFDRFVDQGWGVTANRSVRVKIMAGDLQDGKPRAQLVVLPHIALN
jgi:hypothetical protein